MGLGALPRPHDCDREETNEREMTFMAYEPSSF